MTTPLSEQRLLTLLCDFEGAGKDARDIGDDPYAQECEDTASIIREVLQHRQAGTPVPHTEMPADKLEAERALFDAFMASDYSPDRSGETSEADEKAFQEVLFHIWQARATVVDRQIRDLVMMVKMLCRTVKKYNATSQQAKDYTEYLQREGLISATDCLRVVAKDGE